uniref:Leucine-rich repeat-containing protein 58 n=2 Tax=Lygus hesperus TaxID=30085 RepID=A0A0A9WLR2_LYGHE
MAAAMRPIDYLEQELLEEHKRTLDLGYLGIDFRQLRDKIVRYTERQDEKTPDFYQFLSLNNNHLYELPNNLGAFRNLRSLDLSNNRLRSIPDFLVTIPLQSFSAKNNLIQDENLPKTFAPWAETMTELNLGGNSLCFFPMQVLELKKLEYLYLGSNSFTEVPRRINVLTNLSTLCLGGNQITDIPESVGDLKDLEVLIVSDNQLESLPSSIADLNKLKTLQLHKNRLRTLPTEIITLRCLSELSLRDNPLVVKFVNDMTHNPASLLELAARCIKVNDVHYDKNVLPSALLYYLHSAHSCVNPRCNGVFFDTRIEHVKFVDFCGKYRVPLLQYLCSSKCVVNNSNLLPDDEKMRRVLLG